MMPRAVGLFERLGNLPRYWKRFFEWDRRPVPSGRERSSPAD